MEFLQDEDLWTDLLFQQGYDLLGQLDSGSFSDVFAVRVRSTGQAAAVKRMVVRRNMSSDPALNAELACLTLLSTVRGSCVVQLLDSVVMERMAYMILELAPLGDLERYASMHWPLTPRLVTATTRQILSALAHCHRLHIAHRDVNPANVLLVSASVVRLADFGLAVQCPPDPVTGRSPLCTNYLGRQAYLAPEVIHRTRYQPFLADMWSMGCLFLFLLSGKHPAPFTTSLPKETHTLQQQANGKDSSRRGIYRNRPTTPRTSMQYRTNSSGSVESCRSVYESEVDDSFRVLSPDPIAHNRFFGPIPGSDHPQSSLWTSFDSADDPVFQVNSCDGLGIPNDTEETFCRPSLNKPFAVIESELKELSDVDSALELLVSKLCTTDPLDRPLAEEALGLWKMQQREKRSA